MKFSFRKLDYFKSVKFHILGIACLIWFLVRVLPKPDRIRYPCQQMSITMATSYIAFWTLLFQGLGLQIKRLKLKTTVIAPVLIVIFLTTLILFFPASVSFYYDNNSHISGASELWDPIPKEPIGDPKGVNPGRVVWVWDPDCTSWDGSQYWWNEKFNNQVVIERMFSDGIRALTGKSTDSDAWDALFKHFNGGTGYQSGEKIAIKVNLNSDWTSYTHKHNYIDTSPYVVKSLVKDLINIVGVSQSDITIYDASKYIADWFYNRVADDFPNINYIDKSGGAAGRTKYSSSSTPIHFTTGTSRSLPKCVVNAKYMIIVPAMKMHGGSRVTLTGKNLFGTWGPDISWIHSYLSSGEIMSNAAPQADLLLHEDLGWKNLLIIGDGTYGCRAGNYNIERWQMYPFGNDWPSSIFFSQDNVAIDSVMYDFIHVERNGYPSEGAQNYLHEVANPPGNRYDPEGDGTYCTKSLGVHEHWDTNQDIFSSSRYSGPSNKGIDYIAIGGGLKAIADGPYYGLIDVPVQFNGSAFGGHPPYTYEWKFGDGNTSDKQNPIHTYSNPGNHTVTLTVIDDSSNTSNDTTWAWIQETNDPPDKPNINGPATGKKGTEYEYTINATDPDGNNIKYFVDWGDGNTIWTNYNKSGTEIKLKHVWNKKGNYTIRSKTKDTFDEESNWSFFEVTMPKSQKKAYCPLFYKILQRIMQQYPYFEEPLLYKILYKIYS